MSPTLNNKHITIKVHRYVLTKPVSTCNLSIQKSKVNNHEPQDLTYIILSLLIDLI